ncbi:MAG: GNAT family N-acetyltransferase [Planctomycetota bacterium]
MNSISYRGASVDDADAIAGVEVASKRQSIPDLESEQSMNHERCLQRWSGYLAGTRNPKLAKQERVTFVAFDGDAMVGFLGCHHAKRLDWWPADAELQQIYVLKSHQRMGIGQNLFVMMTQWLLNTGVNSVGVGFHAENPYRKFYLDMRGELRGPGTCFWEGLADWIPPSREEDDGTRD